MAGVAQFSVKIHEVPLKWRGNLVKRPTTDCIVLHHAEASRCSVEDIHRWHQSQGWAGIGYHYLVQKDGSIWRGRPEDVMGAHCSGHNAHSLGVCAEGDYEREEMPAAQEAAIVRLVQDLLRRYPGARILGHRELVPTLCPGRNYPLDRIRAAVEVLGMFADLQGHWAQKDVEWLAREGLIKGDERGNFHPDRPITRAEAAVLVRRAIDYIMGRVMDRA